MDSETQKTKNIQFGCLGCLGLLVVCFFVGFVGDALKDNTSSIAPSGKSSNEIKDQEYIGAVTEVIRKSGYECPHIATLTVLGTSPHGPKLEALCGPEDGNTVDPNLNYAVYPDHFVAVPCKPWGAFDNGCKES